MGFFRSLGRIKSIDAIVAESQGAGRSLKRVLGPVDLIALGIGGIIGAGIFALVGTAAAGDAARLGAGPALMVSFLITGVACAFTALCYAEFASVVPISGSAYTYSYATLGELAAWIIGWDLVLEYAVGNVAVAVSWSGYFCEFLRGFGLEFPRWLAVDLRTALASPDLLASAPHVLGVPVVFNLPAVFIVGALTALLFVGIKESARFNAVMVGIKLVVLAVFVAVGAFYVKPEHYTPFAPNGWGGIQAGAAVVFFAFIGFDAVSTTSEECRNPKRDLPIGILGSLAVCTVVYIAVAAVLTGMVSYRELNSAEPLSVAMRSVDLPAVAGFVAFGSIVAHTAVLLVFQLGQPRILFAMSRDGLLPRFFGRVHPRFKTPHVATVVTGLFVASGAALASLEEMADLCSIGTLSAFVLVCAGVIISRHREPDRPRPFRAPWVPWVPLAGIGACLYLMLGLPWAAWIRFGAWLVIGAGIYLAYGRKRSHLARQIPDGPRPS
ncbi:MAG TPA: amino acid permease [Myxococcota bacterium]|nr:amino acid permease [Myxococcota bacterium]HRY92971.1 amino acid permease [Myxococcota bacterium]